MGVTAQKYGDSITPQTLDALEAIDNVMPIDHTQKMLGLIAFLLGQYLNADGVDVELCMPWIDMSDEALLQRAAGGA